MEERIIDIDNLPEGWKIEESKQKSRTTGKKRIFIINEAGECVGALCNTCGVVLGIENFRKMSSNKNMPRSMCKKCTSKSNNEYYKKNSEKVLETQRQWRLRNPEKVKEIYKKSNKKRYKNSPEYFKEKNRLWRLRNPEKFRESKNNNNRKRYSKNPEKFREKSREYRRNNPEKIKAQKHKYRVRKKEVGGSFTTEQLNHCLAFFGGCCAYTGEQLGGYDLDHIKPISKGGTSFIYNLVPTTATANRSKGAKDLEEWYKQQSYYSEERFQKILEWQKIAFQKYNTTEQSA